MKLENVDLTNGCENVIVSTPCKSCGRQLQSGVDRVVADIEGVAFRPVAGYYCEECSSRLRGVAPEEEVRV